MVKVTDPSKTCVKCNGHVTDKHNKKGKPMWIRSKDEDGWICKPCYDHQRLKQPKARKQKREYMSGYRKRPDKRESIITYLRNYRTDPVKHRAAQEYMQIYNSKSMRYRGKSVYLDHVPRIGVCNWCRSVAPFDTELTALHHDEDRYDDDNPLRYTVEICNECHRGETNRLRYIKKMAKIGAYCRHCESKDTRKYPSGSPKWYFNKYGYDVLCDKCYDRFRSRLYDRRKQYTMKSGHAPTIGAWEIRAW